MIESMVHRSIILKPYKIVTPITNFQNWGFMKPNSEINKISILHSESWIFWAYKTSESKKPKFHKTTCLKISRLGIYDVWFQSRYACFINLWRSCLWFLHFYQISRWRFVINNKSNIFISMTYQPTLDWHRLSSPFYA